ncbi:hypothetical protein [Paucibacter sp. XJ19-41]|uniref:hypothetical protein n=1 Tax=Paucibacter sp. XJ19-41 TaxID=2927824 RepID=UPI002349A289|nr:hypothetical protein [Paucibacter sp. XJ19-41]MDC6167447.1 hypothetical protein [Paucibacter sp. XJ19-41]
MKASDAISAAPSSRRELLLACLAALAGSVYAAAGPMRIYSAIYCRAAGWQGDVAMADQPGLAGHVEHHEALGPRLIAAGPLAVLRGKSLYALLVYQAPDDADAQSWLNADPALRGG